MRDCRAVALVSHTYTSPFVDYSTVDLTSCLLLVDCCTDYLPLTQSCLSPSAGTQFKAHAQVDAIQNSSQQDMAVPIRVQGAGGSAAPEEGYQAVQSPTLKVPEVKLG
jgi:hypothetical protein